MKQILVPCIALILPTSSLSSLSSASNSSITSPGIMHLHPWEPVLFSASPLILCQHFSRNCKYFSVLPCHGMELYGLLRLNSCLDFILVLYLLRHEKQACFPQFCIVQPHQHSIFKLDQASFNIRSFVRLIFVHVIFPGVNV